MRAYRPHPEPVSVSVPDFVIVLVLGIVIESPVDARSSEKISSRESDSRQRR